MTEFFNIKSRFLNFINPLISKFRKKHKVSVVIPTMQSRIKVLNKLIDVLLEDEAVDEIIIINNIKKKLDRSHPKLKIYDLEENLYVNCSWNLGMSLIRNDEFLIINDDILGCKDFVSKVFNSGILDKKSTGLVGLRNQCIKFYDAYQTIDIPVPICYTSIPVSFEKVREEDSIANWGCAIFGRKENYYEIPSELKILFGDHYLIKKNVENKKINYKLEGLRFNHIQSSTVKATIFWPIVAQDYITRKKYLDENKKND